MTKPMESKYGCEMCWPDSPEAAHQASRTLKRIADLIDDSHYIVSIRGCGACTQQFLSVFTEQVDWTDGEDPQYRTLLPITDNEAFKLISAGEAVTEAMINSLGENRRCLQCDFPKGQSKRIKWGLGFVVGPHD